MLEIAILGGSGSGKTQISLKIAQSFDCVILSLDSLSVYQEINIASAKPTLQERGEILHFGIDILNPTQAHNVQIFIQEYQKAKDFCQTHQKNLLITGGTSFYLKSLIQGISKLPIPTQSQKELIKNKLDSLSLQESYALLNQIDEPYATKLKPTDTYRITKALSLYFLTQMPPSEYFKANPPKPLLKDCEIYEIVLNREDLKEKITQRTQKMLENGLISEVQSLKNHYGTDFSWAKSIGIKETLEYLKGNLTLEDLKALIITHTMQLAKRQRTFNKTQFPPHFCANTEEICSCLTQRLQSQTH